MSPQPVLTGGCQCGRVTYTSTTLPTHFTNCCCKTCSRLSGGPFFTFADIPVSAINWTSGEEYLMKKSYSEIAERTHCVECGTPISMVYKCEPETIGITAASINMGTIKGTLPHVKSYIFVGEEAPAGWYTLPDDGVPRYSKFNPGFQERIGASKS
ncbi:Uncharacterized protein BP5553_03372 [Venustampulla echinocandica]|uniref:CENP-V/GFA domain-containing protein n=1 Tax=Venustampulla echinocandica TaxID=2656787 RepID=A0A370TU25_9HELO|nr:Uncharacterized protein BP5553_03372 [Venustampulla echinocandica]RDL39032.1 Uncharacterized protein BP5553_03372 [Venustampulla echinocandica]